MFNQQLDEMCFEHVTIAKLCLNFKHHFIIMSVVGGFQHREGPNIRGLFWALQNVAKSYEHLHCRIVPHLSE